MSQTTGTSHEKSQQWGQLGQWKVRWAPILQEAERSYTCRVEKGPHCPHPPATRGAATRGGGSAGSGSGGSSRCERRALPALISAVPRGGWYGRFIWTNVK